MNWWKLANLDITNWSNDQLQQYFLENKTRFLADPQAQADLRDKGMVANGTVLRLVGNGGLANYCQRLLNALPELQQARQDFQRRQDATRQAEDVDDYLYHVTSKSNLRTIKTRGLVPGGNSNFGGWYQGHSKGKVFLTERGGVSFWKERIATNREQLTGGRITPAVVRVPKSAVQGKVQPDDPGSQDAKHNAFYATESIPANLIEVVG